MIESIYRSSTKKLKTVKSRRRVSSSECPSTVALKRSRTMSEGAKWREKSEAEQGFSTPFFELILSVAENYIYVSCFELAQL